jgi:hypothetical protein
MPLCLTNENVGFVSCLGRPIRVESYHGRMPRCQNSSCHVHCNNRPSNERGVAEGTVYTLYIVDKMLLRTARNHAVAGRAIAYVAIQVRVMLIDGYIDSATEFPPGTSRSKLL